MLASFLCLDFPNTKALLHESRNSVRSMAYQTECYRIRNPALLTRELETIHELTKGLEYQLDEPCPAKLKPTVQDILICLDRCRAMVRSNGKQHAEPVQEIKSHVANTVASSPHAITNTPWSRGDGQNFQDMPKKRKIQTTHVQQVCMHEKFEGPPEDGHSWRKYGQKGILGTKNPRAYYRCRHRDMQGCMAKKQVQRSEENPSIYNITYKGIHTCVEMPQPIQMPATIPEKQDPPQENMNSLAHQNSSDSQMHMNFTNSLTVKTENLNRQDFGTVSFPCTPITYERAQNFHSSTSENYHMSGMYSPFNSLMTSDFNLLPWPAPQIGSAIGAIQSDLSELIPAATSTTSPPCANSDFAWEWTNF